MQRWITLALLVTIVMTSSGCATVLGGLIGNAVPRYETEMVSAPPAKMTTATPPEPSAFAQVPIEREVGTYSALGAGIGGAIDFTAAAVVFALLLVATTSHATSGFGPF